MKKKPQRHSYKKLLSSTRNAQIPLYDKYPKQQSYILQPSSTRQKKSKNKSSERILSVYESNKAKFKLGKFLNDKGQRIRTEQDQFNRTKSSYHNRINSVRKVNEQQKKPSPRQHPTSSGKQLQFIEQSIAKPDSTKQRVFNKRLNLNSQLFQSIANSKNSVQKYEIPQTSKHGDKKNPYSFRKQHNSYRAMNKRTALEKYISESLQNLQTAKNVPRNVGKRQDSELKNMQGSSKQKTAKKQQSKRINIPITQANNNSRQNGDFVLELKKKLPSHNRQHQDPKQTRSIRSPEYAENSHRRLKTEKPQSTEKIEIRWQKKRKNPYDMSNEEMDTFGDRFPDGFEKIKLLGRGGFSLVWLGEHKKSKKRYAIKQILTQSNHQTHMKQIWFGSHFFQFGGMPKPQFTHHPGVKNLVKLHYYFMNKKDTWLVYQKCGDSLGNALYQLKGQNYNNQKMYRIHYKQLYDVVRQDQNEIRKIIFQIARALELLAESNIVHSDLKTENILVKVRGSECQAKTVDAKGSGRRFPNSMLQEVKLIDYGSSFEFKNLRQFSMATPQYMAPQILNFILYQNQLQYIPKLFDYVQQYHDPWVIDVWSLGCVILEIISGIPLWMSLKTIVKRKGKELIRYGLFAVKGRTFDKIIKKQLEVVQNLQKYLGEENYSDIVIEDDLKFLLKRMLALNPAKRISPSEIIEFLSKKTMQKS